jgi:hypothetical protein
MCRALLETIVIEKGAGDKGSFNKNIAAYLEKGLITQQEEESLKTIIYEAGSAVMHRAYRSNREAVEYALNAIEHLMERIYIQPDEQKYLASTIPLRKKKLPKTNISDENKL